MVNFLLLTYVSECLTNQIMGRILHKVLLQRYTLTVYIAFNQSHRPVEAIPDSYDKCEPGVKAHIFMIAKVVIRLQLLYVAMY